MKKPVDQCGALVVNEQATIRDAMAAVNAAGREVVLLQDNGGSIIGLITDGDLRRGLLAGHVLESPALPIATREFYSVGPQVERATVLDVMKARGFSHVPVLDDRRRLIAIHFLRDLIGANVKPNIAVVMAGGQGTRLRPLTEAVPKPMIRVAGRPMLERIVLHLVGHGIRQIFVAVNYRAEVIEAHFGDGSAFGCRIEYLRESEPRGTGGALGLLGERPTHPILVLNGDQVTQVDVSAMLETHVRSGNLATMGVGPHQVQIPFATVTERDGQLVRLEEKPNLNFLINRGLYVFEPAALEFIDEGEFPITVLFERLLSEGKRVGVFYSEDYWLDVGRPADLLKANGVG